MNWIRQSTIPSRRCFARYVAPLLLMAAAASAQLEELYSRHVRVIRPKGEFAARLVRLEPPGDGWREVTSRGHGFRLLLPKSASLDEVTNGSRVLEVVL